MKTTEQAIYERILYIGDEIPEAVKNDKRPKFVLLGSPQEFINETTEKVPDFNKDFYDDLPSMVCESLDFHLIPKFHKEEWFSKAWEEYRQHVKSSTMDEVKMPAFVFQKYITTP